MRRFTIITSLSAVAVVTSFVGFSGLASADEPATPPPAPAPDTSASAAPPPAPVVTEVNAAAAAEAPADDAAAPLAGWHGGLFFLRSQDDQFRLYIQGRAQIDSYNYFGAGIADQPNGTNLKSTIFLRRARAEISGEFLGDFQWMLAGDWGATGLDNAKGTNETSAAGPGVAPTATTGRYNSAQTPTLRATATDVFINWKANPLFQIQLGQYDAPFTMENRTSDKYIPFMERSLAVRAVGIPTNKEIGAMFWGEAKDKLFFYSVGFFNGDGQGRLSPDNRMDTIGRVFVHPLNTMKGPLKDLQIGGSFRYGVRDSNYVNYDYAPLSTQGGFTFFNTNYGGSKGNTHILPAGKQTGFAGELRVPFVDQVDLTSEFVYIKNETREAVEGFQAANTERFGSIKGYAYYVQLGFWPMGGRDINGMPGYENPTHVDLKKPDTKPKTALQLLLKWEQLNLEYVSNSRSGDADAKGVDGKIKVNALSVGANLWMTKHLRFSANYIYNMFPDSAPTSASAADGPKQTSDQRAIAPAQNLKAGINDSARDTGHGFHELLFRAAVAF